ncbi:hypothetical protein [Mycolicibacterium fluoranthenivorans]|uniref:hypothetical protein n=1 Tax=Mycolicibacterium fluoranthenivorans TaxID=258505 RepID=UPI00111398CC|nr:hypothetical protein [Mycolicibacterium fluoranthenivorans]
MSGYFEALEQRVDAAQTSSFKAVPLDLDEDHPLRSRGYFPMLLPGCVCVTDPCPCDERKDDVIVWVADSDVRSRVSTGLKSKGGDELLELLVERDAHVITETLSWRSASSLSGPFAKGVDRGIPRSRRVLNFGPTQIAMSTECAGNTLWMVVEGPDGSGGTLFEYIAIGSC